MKALYWFGTLMAATLIMAVFLSAYFKDRYRDQYRTAKNLAATYQAALGQERDLTNRLKIRLRTQLDQHQE